MTALLTGAALVLGIVALALAVIVYQLARAKAQAAADDCPVEHEMPDARSPVVRFIESDAVLVLAWAALVVGAVYGPGVLS